MTTAEARSRPRRIVYLLALVPLLIGIGVMTAIIFSGVAKLEGRLEQIVVPGERVLTLEPGRYTVFLETRSMVHGQTYLVDEAAGLSVTVTGSDGREVGVVEPDTYSAYSLGTRQGHSILGFQIEATGTYAIAADYPEEDGPTTVIAVGRGFMAGLLVVVLTGMTALLAGLLVSVMAVIWVAVRRRKARRSIA